MSSLKKKTTSTTNQTMTSNVAPTNPSWLEPQVQGLAGKIGSTFNGLDPYSLVAGPDPLQTQAAQDAAGLGVAPGITAAQSAGPQSVQGASLLDNLQSYMSPYTNDVVDTTLRGFDQNSNQVRQQQQLDLGGDSTFGGSGGSILRSLTEGQLGLGRAQTEAGLRDSAFNTGASLSGQDAERRQSASTANAGFAEQALQRQLAAGQAQGSEQRANIAQQTQLGEILRQIEAAKKLAPITALGAQGSLISGLPLDLFHGSNTTGSLSGTTKGTQSGVGLGDLLGYFAANAQAAGQAMAGGG